MKKTLILAVCCTLISLFPWQPVQIKAENSYSRFAHDHIIVKLKSSPGNVAASLPDNGENIITAIGSSQNLEIKSIKKLFPPNYKRKNFLYKKYELESYYIVFFAHDINAKDISKKFETDGHIDFAEPDFYGEPAGKKGELLIPNDPFLNRQWGLQNDGNIRTTTGRPGKVGADMNVIKAWDIETGSEDILVAILDSGVKLDHPDLTGRIWVNKDEIKNGRDDDNNGYIDDINGYNFAYENSSVKDDLGHGTNIAGTIGASTNNALGYAGVDQKCKIMICKNLSYENSGEYSWWSESMIYAADNGAKIINMSEGGHDFSNTLQNAVRYASEAGCLIVASMMNKDNSEIHYPASFPEVMAVGATDTDDSRCREFTWGGGSNWGKYISVIAPGNRIYGLDYQDNFNYDIYWSGTSQATAYVSAIASLLLAQDNSRTSENLKKIITSTAVDLVGDPREDTPGWDQFYGYGRVDLYAALTYGKLPSGNKKETKIETNKYPEEIKAENEDDKRAKADEPGEKRDEKDERRAKKPEPDNKR